MRRCLRCGLDLADESALEVVTIARPAAPYASGDRVANRYLVLEAYGTGPLGTCYKARDEAGNAVAVKVLAQSLLPTSPERDAFVASIAQLKGRSLRRVALPIDAGIDAGATVFVVSRWVFGASLRRVLRAYRAAEKKLDVDQALGVLSGIAAALRELHTISPHGALYPESVQITADAVELTDAAIAAALPPARFAAHMSRHPEVFVYLAPEVRAGKRCNAGADLFSLGALASELLFHEPTATSLAGSKLPDTSPDLEEALRALVSVQPTRRAGALPLVIERLTRAAGSPSLPSYAVLPQPAPAGEARTRRIRSAGTAAPEAIGPAPRARPKS